MKRVLTALIAVPLALAAIFLLPSGWFLGLVAIVILWSLSEFIVVVRVAAPKAPLQTLYVLVPLAVWLWMPGAVGMSSLENPLSVAALALSAGVGSVVLLARTPVDQAVAGVGILAFGTLYFALPLVVLAELQRLDPWILFLVLGIVWCGDAAAYYFGTYFGRHKLAPTVSPNKSWEGAIASFLTAFLIAGLWGWWRLGYLDGKLLLLAGCTGVAAQMGDLVESLLKRGAAIKDSGNVLPGHGGFWDRMDALLFAAPVFYLGLGWIGRATLIP